MAKAVSKFLVSSLACAELKVSFVEGFAVLCLRCLAYAELKVNFVEGFAVLGSLFEDLKI